jgi:osmotically-inducible protein OsmY
MKFFNDRIVSATGDSVRADDEVSANIKTRFSGDSELKSLNLDVEAVPGVVELKGQVSSQELSKKAEDLARSAAGTRTIKNSISVTA